MNLEDLTNLIGSGARADVYCVGDKAIKLFKEQCTKEDVFCEASLHSMAESAELPVPKIYEVIQIEDRMAIVMDMIEGVTFKNIIFEDLDNLKIYLDTLIDLQIQTHDIKVIGFPSMKEKFIHTISNSEFLHNRQKYRLLLLLDSMEIGNSLCHGDFHFMNLIKSDKEVKIIDWMDAKSGSPEADICRSYMIYALYSKEFADIYLATYCKKISKPQSDILRWLPIVAAVRLSENNEGEREGLLHWVDMENYKS